MVRHDRPRVCERRFTWRVLDARSHLRPLYRTTCQPRTNMDLLIWLGPAALSGAALIISMLMVGRRVDLLGEYSVELRRLNFAVQASQEEVSRILEVLTPLSSTLPRLADVNLHLCQLKRQ